MPFARDRRSMAGIATNRSPQFLTTGFAILASVKTRGVDVALDYSKTLQEAVGLRPERHLYFDQKQQITPYGAGL